MAEGAKRGAQEIVFRNPQDITPDPRNARTHSDAQIKQIMASITRFGFTVPVLVRKDLMIGAGHGRWQASKKLKLASIPTIMLELTDAEWKAYAIADNAIPLGAAWDMDILRQELGEIPPADLEGLGIGSLLDGLAPPPEDPATRTGTRVNQTVIQHNIVFDDEQQQANFHEFVRELKVDPEYAGLPTFAARLDKFLLARKPKAET